MTVLFFILVVGAMPFFFKTLSPAVISSGKKSELREPTKKRPNGKIIFLIIAVGVGAAATVIGVVNSLAMITLGSGGPYRTWVHGIIPALGGLGLIIFAVWLKWRKKINFF